MSFFSSFACVALIGSVIIAGATSNTIYDLNRNFPSGSNPSGVWSFGTNQLGTAFTLFPPGTTSEQNFLHGFTVYHPSPYSDGPSVYEITYPYIMGCRGPNSCRADSWEADSGKVGELWMHPDSSDSVIVRFRAPSSGRYLINATFAGNPGGYPDYVYSNSRINIYVNNRDPPIYTQAIHDELNGAFRSTLSLLKNDNVSLVIDTNQQSRDYGGVRVTYSLTAINPIATPSRKAATPTSKQSTPTGKKATPTRKPTPRGCAKLLEAARELGCLA